MNLARLENMVRDGDMSRDAFVYLLNCRAECEWLDYKVQLHLDTDRELCAFAKDVVAFKNVGGGFIVVGVEDKTWNQVGLSEELPYDSKMLRDKVVRATDLTLDLDIVHHYVTYENRALPFALIHIRASKKRSKRRSPTLVGKDFCRTQRFGLSRGQIYVRNGDSTVVVSSQAEHVELLNALESYADQQQLAVEEEASQFAIEDDSYRLVDRGFENFVGRLDLRERLVEALIQDPRIWIINVHGPGGVGKSALVNWATHELYRRRSFEAILQLTAKETILTGEGIRAYSRSLYSLENLLDHILDLFLQPLDGDLVSKKDRVTELLSIFHTLLVLDNMETVSDGRILNFIQDLPPSNKAKVLITSRQKTGAWELPIPVSELSTDEVREFIHIKSREIDAAFPFDSNTASRVEKVSGGLPLAVQWIIGQYKATKNLDTVLGRVKEKDSPVLEFSFRNIWTILSDEARTILAVLSVFDDPPTVQHLSIATEMHTESIEKALAELIDVTLVVRSTQQSDGRVLYSTLPITLSFARNELSRMGDLELRCRRRLNQFTQQMELQQSEVAGFRSTFDKYNLTTDNERRAAILCRRAESEVFAGNIDQAETLFQQARDLAPQNAYVHAMSASYYLTQKQLGQAMEHVTEACRRATKRTGALCHTIKARILNEQRNRRGTIEAYSKAVEYDPKDVVLRHQYGVALSQANHEAEAVKQFSTIIDAETTRVPPRETLLIALTTRIINLKRLDRREEAQADIELARSILDSNVHLQPPAFQLHELLDNEN